MTSDLAAARLNMVESQVRTSDVTDVRLQDAMRTIPRERFVPQAKAQLAYAETAVEYAPGRFLLEPRHLAKLIQALSPRAGETALAIAAPYGAAVLEALGLTVTRLDGESLDAAPQGGFDVIVVEGAVARAPQSWIGALAPGGRLGVIERDGPVGHATLYMRSPDGVGRRTLFDATAPFLAGFSPQHGFAF